MGTIGDMKTPLGLIAGATTLAAATSYFWAVADMQWPWIPAIGFATGTGFWIGAWYQATRHAQR